MWMIQEGLYLGDVHSARDWDALRLEGITHILNCAEGIPCYYPTDFIYHHAELDDPDPDFQEHIPQLCEFIEQAREQGAVLVHCRAGLSRSPSAILAYLCHRGMTLDEALDMLKDRVGETDYTFIPPDELFLELIAEYFENCEEERD